MNQFDGILHENIPLTDKNTYAIGGNARYFGVPENEADILALLDWARSCGHPVFMLGKGSNVLISDNGWPGLVLQLPASGKSAQPEWNGNSVEVGGGASLNALVKDVADRGFIGMEELAGIPGTVGGAVVMNAGAYSDCIADTLVSVTCLSLQTGIITRLQAAELSLGYRTSRIKNSGQIVLSARFAFSQTGEPHSINEIRKNILERRKAKQPLDYPNCGSVFKRPPGNFAGTLIEQCGLKGVRCGGAQVSEKHANFIINTGNASAADVRHLICRIQCRVYEFSGLLLEPEVIFVGEFEEALYIPPLGKS